MPNRFLHGNGYKCPACELRRAEIKLGPFADPPKLECNECDSTGRIALTAETIIAKQVAWNTVHYWSRKSYA